MQELKACIHTIGTEMDDRYIAELKKAEHPSGNHQSDGKRYQDCLHSAYMEQEICRYAVY